MTDLKPCPCGKVLERLVIDCMPQAKYGHVAGNCCNEWWVEFRNQYETDPMKIIKIAAAAWNSAPRGNEHD